MYDTERKIKNQIIRNIKFALARKKVPEEILDQIDLEAVVEVEPSTVRAYEQAPTRRAKGEIISELYHETLSKLMETYPILKNYFRPHTLKEVEEDQRRFLESMWDLYARAEAGDEVALETIKEMGYDLDSFRRLLERESRELEELESETAEQPAKQPSPQQPREARAIGAIKPLTAFSEEEERPESVEKPKEEKVEAKPPEETKEGAERLPPALRPLIVDMLRYTCRSIFLGAGYPIKEATKKCSELWPEINSIADEVVNGRISRDEAVKRVQQMALSILRPVEEVKPLKVEFIEEKRKKRVSRAREVEARDRGGEAQPFFKEGVNPKNILYSYGCTLLRFGYKYFIRHYRGKIGLFTAQAEDWLKMQLVKELYKFGRQLLNHPKRGLDYLLGIIFTEWPDVVIEKGIREAVLFHWDELRYIILEKWPQVYEWFGSKTQKIVMGYALKLAGCSIDDMPEDIAEAYAEFEGGV